MSAETPAAAPKKSRKKLIIVAALGLVLASGGAGAAWFMLRKPADGAAAVAEKKPPAKPVFMPLDVFTVNLQDPRGERFAQVGVTLQLKDAATEAELKERLPAVRNEILLLLSSKRIDELLSDDGKRELAQQIRARAAHGMGLKVDEPAVVPAAVPAAAAASGAAVAAAPKAAPVDNPVHNVLFSQFIVQ
ncbi:MAG: flagellar basal body-associated protein FliL [Ramlibacter sp.]